MKPKALDWHSTLLDGWSASTPLNTIYTVEGLEEGMGWRLERDGILIAAVVQLSEAFAAAQADYNTRAWSCFEQVNHNHQR